MHRDRHKLLREAKQARETGGHAMAINPRTAHRKNGNCWICNEQHRDQVALLIRGVWRRPLLERGKSPSREPTFSFLRKMANNFFLFINQNFSQIFFSPPARKTRWQTLNAAIAARRGGGCHYTQRKCSCILLKIRLDFCWTRRD